MRVGGAVAKRCHCDAPNCRGFIGGHQSTSHIMTEANSEDEEDLEPIMIEEEIDDDVGVNGIEVNAINPINTKVGQTKSSQSMHDNNWIATTSKLEVSVKRKLQRVRDENGAHASTEQIKRTKMSMFLDKVVGLGLKQPHGACATFKHGNAHQNFHNNSYSDGRLFSSI